MMVRDEREVAKNTRFVHNIQFYTHYLRDKQLQGYIIAVENKSVIAFKFLWDDLSYDMQVVC